ncbi:MAG: transposase, partial [Bacteroidales bacterium]
MKNYTAILEPDSIYHVYNRANGNENLFYIPDNYDYFLQKYIQYIHPIAETFCYCLMPNHFHLLIRIKSEDELLNLTGLKNINANLTGLKNLSGLLSQQFSNLFNSYSKAINKQQGRKGSLFIRPYKRKNIDSTFYLRKLVQYIHFNPIEAGLCYEPSKYKYSSYSALLSDSKTLL